MCIIVRGGYDMSKKVSKFYGRKSVNKLDWLLAIVCSVIALGAIWLSIGVSIHNAGGAAIPAFEDVLHGIAFMWCSKYGSSLAIIIIAGLFFYEALIYLVAGIIYLCKKGKKERVPGVVAGFVAVIGFVFFLAFIFEFAGGASKGAIHGVWPYGLIVFAVALLALTVLSVLATFTKYNIEFEKSSDEEKVVVHEKVVEVVKVKEVVKEAEKAPEVKEEPKEEPKPEVKEEPKPEVKEEPKVEEQPESFMGLGARRRRIPFESKIKRSNAEVRARYAELKKVLDEYDLNDRFSIPGETFSYKRQKLIFITFSGNTLKIHFALDPKEFENSPIPMKSAADVKRFEETPSYLRVKSGLAIRRCINLARRVMSEHKVPKK